MTLPGIREVLSEAIRYVRSDPVEAARLMIEAAVALKPFTAGTPPDRMGTSALFVRLGRNVLAAKEALVVDPDAAAGGIALVRHELGLAIGRSGE